MATPRGADDSAARRNLSKNVLQMKFMKRSQSDRDEHQLVTKKKDDSHWVLGGMQRQIKKNPFEFDVSYLACEELLPVGRMSYMNFNPGVEKNHAEILLKAKIQYSFNASNDTEGITDEEMAKRYESLVSTIGKKFEKSKPGSKRSKKQQDDSSSDNNPTSDSESDEDIRQLKKRVRRGFIKPKTD